MKSVAVPLLLVSWGTSLAAAQGPTVEFNRDIRPILSNNCFVCHGPDNNLRKAKLRLDTDKDAAGVRGGASVIVPGKPQESELYRRLITHEESERMPPKKANRELTKQQIDLIRRWIEQGAVYQKHWSLITPTRAATPKVKTPGWVRNPIDAFVLARLEVEGLKPSPEADRRTLLRRLSFDLTGLPPTWEEMQAFEKDTDPQAYERAVERLLASPHFGERLALFWLDVVRYADTGGYHSDNHRDVWMYRDWVIEAFNRNIPFDQFTIEQLAGDLLPGATVSQKIGSGYNRLLQTTEEGGAQPKEYQAKYYADRIRNFATGFMGLTLGCTECHDHKFDPFSLKEFYQLQAFFADIQEKSVGRQEQTPLVMPEQAEKLKRLDGDIAALEKALLAPSPELDQAQAKWEAEVRASAAKGLPKEIAALFAVDAKKLNAKQKQALTVYYRENVAGASKASGQKLAAFKKEKSELLKTVPTSLISISGPPRTIRVLPRGNWLDDSGEIVKPATPASLPALKVTGDGRATRLDLAKWLVSPEHPLTSRVFVNRLWALYFGQGIAKTMDDLGAQGAWPTHPELLDWLAVDFRESGWDVKRLIKLIVTSNAYRQTSKASEVLKQRDPYNELLARQGRFRLDAELVRDNALAVGGLLVKKIGGPSVKPYQPAGYWKYLNFPMREWYHDKNENQYRRGLYTYWQRTFLHPSLLAFDASTREECTVQRPRSNTPQQALVLLNDPTYVEAARALAERILKEGGKSAAERIDFAFRTALQRHARSEEVKILSDLLVQHLKDYQADTKAAEAFLRVGERLLPKDLAASELAAWTQLARVVINLHEMITRN